MNNRFKILTLIFLFSFVFSHSLSICYGSNFLDKVKEERENHIEKDIKIEDTEFTHKIKEEAKKEIEFDKEKFENITINTQTKIEITAKATAMKFLPIIIAFGFTLFLVGYLFEKLAFLQFQAMNILFLSGLGIFLIFIAYPLVKKLA